MKVKELIEKLQELDQETELFLDCCEIMYLDTLLELKENENES